MDNKVIVLILGYNSISYLDECLSSVLIQSYKDYEVWFADNGSFDGSVEFVSKKFPTVKTIQFKKNTGYAGGNSKLVKMAFEKGADFSLILNVDIKADNHLISSLIRTYDSQSKKNKVGLIQPMVMLYDKPKRINSIGNVIHYLGFGYCGGYMSSKFPLNDNEIVSVSGTAMLISKDYCKNVGLFDESFFMYNEDQDYSWRGLMMGYKHFLSVNGKIWHKYSFSKNKNKWYQSEKNRLIMIFKNYERKTLIKLMPIILFNELAIMVYSILNGWFVQKIKSYVELIKQSNSIFKKKSKLQKLRQTNDLFLLKMFSSDLKFEALEVPLIKVLINPMYRWYKMVIGF